MRLLMLVFAAVTAAAEAHGGTVLYVDDDAPLGGDGQSWNAAFRFLQDALHLAQDDPAVIEVRIAQGFYQPDRDEAGNVAPGSRLASFQMVEGVALRGGFAGIGAADPDERDIIAFESILTGDLLGDDGGEFRNIADNSFQVVTGAGDEAAVLDGFTISRGNANGSMPRNLGGGMYNPGSSPTVMDCRFRENSAIFGGGIYNGPGASPTMINCAFRGNRATNIGGGMRNLKCSPKVINCIFSANTANDGGGMANHTSSPTVVNCLLIWNTAASHGGAMRNSDGRQPKIRNCTFSRNTAVFGGAVSNFNNGSGGAGINCIFWEDSPEEFFGNTIATYSCVQGGNPGVGSIDADPMFVDPDNGDFRLSPGSPCIDAADNTAIQFRSPDFDGNPRLVDDPATKDTGFPVGWPGPIVDMGAYEYQGS